MPRVVAVEDNPADVRLIKEGVAAAGVELALTVYNSGRTAADRFRAIDAETPADHPDLILLDLNLPGASGLELLTLVRTETPFPGVPVVIISSSESRDDINRAYEHAANAYVTKPTDPDNYIDMIEATIEFWITTAARSPANE
jgi:CheY-like chemotaxis protein